MQDAGARAIAASFDLRSLPPTFYDDPYPVYRVLRETEPVRAMPDGSYFLTRYKDLVAVYQDQASFSSDKKEEFRPKFGDSPLYRHHTTSLVFSDPPLHTRVRRLMMGALTARHIAAMTPGLITLVDRLLDRMAEKSQVDLIEDYAAQIPVEIIGNMLGVPSDQRGPLRDWSLAVLGALEPVLGDEQMRRGNDAVRDMEIWLDGLIADRRARPGDPDVDALTRLIQGESNGETLSAEELVQNCIFLLNAGHETTTNLIGNSLAILADWPDQKARLIAEPGLTKTAVEEFLRFESSNQLGNRITTRQVEIGGVTLPAQTRITLCIGAANRDPAQFADPETLDIGRTQNRHLAFGAGPHQCAGMNLGRLEGKVAVERLLARFPKFRIDGPRVRGGRARFRGFYSLPARLA
jgi:cytochrome P450